MTRFARSLAPTDPSLWRSGRFFNAPTPAQALHLALRPKASLTDSLSPYACRLTLME